MSTSVRASSTGTSSGDSGWAPEAAWAAGEEDRRGRLVPGALADLVVLGDDPVTVDTSAIGEIPVLATFVGGECVHGAEQLDARGPLLG